MAPSKIRRALGAVKDQTSIGLAKVGSSNSLADLDVAIVKATRHEEYPADERHIREILSLTSYSRNYISACVNTLSRRLNKTKNWTVALKTLMLIQRLLAEGDPSYEQEIFFATRRGTRLLNMSDFRDASQSNSWDYSAFVRTYALYLDERLEFRMQGRRGRRSAFGLDEDEEETGPACVRSTPVRDMRIDHIFSRIQHLQQLLERFLACRPTGFLCIVHTLVLSNIQKLPQNPMWCGYIISLVHVVGRKAGPKITFSYYRLKNKERIHLYDHIRNLVLASNFHGH